MKVFEEKKTQTEVVPPIAAPKPPIPQSSIVNLLYIYLEYKGLKILIAIIAVLSLIIIAGLVWYIIILNDDKAKTKREKDDLKLEKDDLELEISDLKDNIQELTTSNLGLLANYTHLQADNTELITKNRELVVNMTELQTKYDIQEKILDNYKRKMYDL